MSGQPSSPAIAFAKKVLDVPGGPYNIADQKVIEGTVGRDGNHGPSASSRFL